MRYFCRTAHLPGDGIIACNVLFFFAFLASFREQLPTPGSNHRGRRGVGAARRSCWTALARALPVLGLGLALSTPALAHKLRVFAAAEGDLITGSAYFAGGGAAGGAQISILDGQGRTLATPTPDAQGRFSYRVQAPADLVVVAQTGDGHRTEWRIAAAELAGAFAAGTPVPAPTNGSEPPAAAPTAAAPASAPTAAAGAADAALEAAIERALARQIRPLREDLMAAEDRTRLRDILGGIGYIVGLTGLALWWRSRRPNR